MNSRRRFLLSGGTLVAGAALPQAVAVAGDDRPAKPTAPKLVEDGGGEAVWAMGVRVTVKVRSGDTAGAYSVFEDVVPPGGGPPPHTHSREDETMYVLEGELEATLGGGTQTVRAGTFVHMPRGVPHSFKNVSDKPARLLMSYVPGGFEAWFAEVGTPVRPGGAAPPKSSQEDIRRAIAAAERHGVRFEHK